MRQIKFTCRDTQNSINWLALCAEWRTSLSKGEAAKPNSFADYQREKELYKIFVIIIIIAYNHGQGKIKNPLTLILMHSMAK